MESFRNDEYFDYFYPTTFMENTYDTPIERTERRLRQRRPLRVPRYEVESLNNFDVYASKTMPKWFTVVDMEDLVPEEMVATLNPERHVLVIKARRITHSYKEERDCKNIVERIIRLPKNICLEKLKVVFTPRREIIVTAPYLNQVRDEENVFHQRTPLFTETKFPIVYKRPQRFYRFYDEYVNFMEHKTPMFDETEFNNQRESDIIRDAVTGLKKMQFEVNTTGFYKDEILVKIDETERLLIVEAKKEEILRDVKQEITPKYLRREFTLPRFLNLKKTVFHLTKRGTLLIQVPFLVEEPSYRGVYGNTEEEKKMWLKPRFF